MFGHSLNFAVTNAINDDAGLSRALVEHLVEHLVGRKKGI